MHCFPSSSCAITDYFLNSKIEATEREREKKSLNNWTFDKFCSCKTFSSWFEFRKTSSQRNSQKKTPQKVKRQQMCSIFFFFFNTVPVAFLLLALQRDRLFSVFVSDPNSFDLELTEQEFIVFLPHSECPLDYGSFFFL